MFLGEDPQTPRKERLLPINIHTIKFRTPHLQILYTPMLWRSVTITVYKYEFDKSMLMCVIIIIKDHKMKQIFNDLPKIIPELYLNYSIIKNVTAGLQRFVSPSEVTYAQWLPINDNWVLNNHDHQTSLYCSNHHLKHHNIGHAS